MDRYVETLLYMYRKEPEFCQLPGLQGRLPAPLSPADARLPSPICMARRCLDFLEDLVALQDKNLQRIADELEWFTLKFDYRNQDKPWGNSKDAVERTLKKLQGHAAFGEGTDKKG